MPSVNGGIAGNTNRHESIMADLLSMEMPEEVVYTANSSVAVIALNRPSEKNALDERLMLGLRIAIERVKAAPLLRVVFLTGNGPMFCAGGDPKGFQRMAAAGPSANHESAVEFAEMLKVKRA